MSAPQPSLTSRVLLWIAVALLSALYLYAVVAAVGNWVGIAGYAQALAGGLSLTGIMWLSLGVLIPVIAYVVALVVARRRTAGMRLLVLVLGLSLTAAMQLNLMHFIPTTTYFDHTPTVDVLE